MPQKLNICLLLQHPHPTMKSFTQCSDLESTVLAKRSRSDYDFSNHADRKRQRSMPLPNPAVAIAHCEELVSILLERLPEHARTNGISPKAALSAEYSPRLLHLVEDIAATLQCIDQTRSSSKIHIAEAAFERDAVVPSIYSELQLASDTSAKVSPLLLQKPLLSDQAVPVLPTSSKGVYNADTEIAISRIFELGKVDAVRNPHISAHTPHHGPSVITMSGFGQLGRFGNQMLQYLFLRVYAERHNICEIQVPQWVGAQLFGHKNQSVERAFPPVVEYRETLANSTFTTDFIDYVKKCNPDHDVQELHPVVLGDNIGNEALANVDIWGWFQWHTSHFAGYKQLIQDTFTPVPKLKEHLENIFSKQVRFRDGKKRTVVGLHLRLGDYQNIAASSFGYCAPTSWYLKWLSEIWETLDNPVLFVASDDINAVLRDFAAYNPVTADSIDMKMPTEMKGVKAGFFPDWFGLTQCDVLAISNSTFSFSACLMNTLSNTQFFRAHYNGAMEKFQPWNADPIIHRDTNKAGLAAALETLQVVYNTQGSRGLAKNLLYEIPYYAVRSAIMKAVLWRQSRVKLSETRVSV